MECEAEVNLVAGEEGGTMFCFSKKKKKSFIAWTVEHSLCARNLAGCWGRMIQVASLPFPAVTGDAG